MFDEALRKILESSKYDYLTGRKTSFKDRITELIYKIIEWIFDKLNFEFTANQTNINTNLIANIFYISAALVVVILISLILFYFFKRKRKKALLDDIFTEFKNNKLTFNELEDLALKTEREENYRDALRYHYIALILIISNTNIITVPDSMTGGQFIRKIKAEAPILTEGVTSTVNLFYVLYFGHKQISSETYNEHKAKYTETVRRVQNYEKN